MVPFAISTKNGIDPEVGMEQLERGGVLGLGLHESVHICKVLTNRP